MTCDPFQVLLPEIWTQIRNYLTTDIDARDRLCLQRTCKAAYKLDPGAIYAPGWARLFQLAKKEPRTSAWRLKIHIYKALQEITKSHLLDRRWFVMPRIFDYDMYSNGEDNYNNEIIIVLDWEFEEKLITTLTYDTGEDHRWQLAVCYDDLPVSAELRLNMDSLEDLLHAAPTLGFGVDLEKVHAWADSPDFADLFVKKEYHCWLD